MDLPQTSRWNDLVAPSLDDLAHMAETIRAAFPPPFDMPARAVLIHVEEYASDEILASMGLQDPFELTGLYDGVPLTERSVSDPPQGPDIVWLYRRAILDEWVARGDVALFDLLANVVTHEFAHHFGWSDDDIARIDRWWE